MPVCVYHISPMWVHVRAEGWHSGFLNHFSMLYFLRQGLSLNLNLLQLDWLASDSLKISLCLFPVLWLERCAAMLGFFMVLGTGT